MRKIVAVFCSPKGETVPAQIMHKLTSGVVKAVTNSIYGHAALVLPTTLGANTFEMIWPGITKTEGMKYTEENCYALAQHEIPVSDESFAAIEAKLQEWMGRNVGYALFTGCVAAGTSAVMGPDAGNEIDEHWSRRFDTMMCSEMVTEAIRVAYPDFVPGVAAGAVNPDMCDRGVLALKASLTDWGAQ